MTTHTAGSKLTPSVSQDRDLAEKRAHFGRLHSHPVGDTRQRMPYVLKLYLYLFVAGVITTLIAVRLAPLGLLVNLVYAFSGAYLWIVIGRWLLNKPNGL